VDPARAHPADGPGGFADAFDRAADAGAELRRRRRLPPGEAATGRQVARRIDRLGRVEAGPDALTRLAVAAQAGDARARERLVERSLPAIWRQARRYAGRDVSVADLVQEGVVGLLRALAGYDSARGQFPAYAAWWLRQAMQQAIAEQSRAVRLPTHVLWDMHDLKEASETFAREHRRSPTAGELEDALGWSRGRLDDVLRAQAPAASLDVPAGGTPDGPPLADLVEDPLASDTFERVLVETTGGSVRALLSTLTERERQVLAWRFGLEGDELSLREIGRRLGMSGERVRQLEGRALAKLRTAALPPADGVDTGRPALT
jgi:RNA polymerase sigma factor (sigma-70 family)